MKNLEGEGVKKGTPLCLGADLVKWWSIGNTKELCEYMYFRGGGGMSVTIE